MNIVLLGPPASGKGTQASLLVKKFGLYHLHSGHIARELGEKDPRIKEIVKSGELIPEEEMSMHVIAKISAAKTEFSNILFEGFPRFISQFKALENFLKDQGDDIDGVFSIDISEETAIKRVSSRRICKKCDKTYNLITNPPSGKFCSCGGELVQREDDKEDVIKNRFVVYRENTEKLINHLNEINKIEIIAGERSIEEIQKDLVEKISKLK